ncbi:MAG: PIG-L deacetylase family protein [Anaerolineales bacterium]
MANTVLALVPHPDDAEFFAGGLLAKFAKQGATVIEVIATDGCRGSYDLDTTTLIQLRAQEAYNAAKVLGAQPPILLGYHDFELDRLPAGELRQQFIYWIRKLQPNILVSEDPYGLFEPHPDHRAVAWAAYEAVHFAELPLIYEEQIHTGLQPHFVAEKYYYTQTTETNHKIIDISDTIEIKIAALSEHRSQITFLVEGILRQAQQAKLDLKSILGDTGADAFLLFQIAMRMQAAEIGHQGGFEYGESYRYERYHAAIEAQLALTNDSAS